MNEKLIKKLLFSKSNQIKPVQWGGLRKVKPIVILLDMIEANLLIVITLKNL